VSVQVSQQHKAILLIISSTGSLVNNNREKMNDFIQGLWGSLSGQIYPRWRDWGPRMDARQV
jgi:hypothetical protein